MSATFLYRCSGGENELLYVGITGDLGGRLADHARTQPWWIMTSHIEIETYPDRDAAARAERLAIKQDRPLFNVVHIGEGRRSLREPPAPRPAVRPELARRLRLAARKQKDWLAERDQMIAQALEEGGKLQEVADLVGLTDVGVMKIRDRQRRQS